MLTFLLELTQLDLVSFLLDIVIRRARKHDVLIINNRKFPQVFLQGAIFTHSLNNDASQLPFYSNKQSTSDETSLLNAGNQVE